MTHIKPINLAIIIVMSIGFIFLGGVFMYKHHSVPYAEKNPIYFAFGIAFAGGGGRLLTSLIMSYMIPNEVLGDMNKIKNGQS